VTRVVVVDHAYRVLLLHVTDPRRPARGTWWEVPLRDEAGDVRLGPCVWLRRRERFHVAWLDDPAAPRAEVPARAALLGERWWTLDELAGSDETFDPPALPVLAPAVVRGEYAAPPVDLTSLPERAIP
jgi:hypothetical protein